MRPILFDFDGTLADTMSDHFSSWRFVLKAYGILLEERDYYPLEGLGLKEVAVRLIKEKTLNSDEINQIVYRKKQYYITNYRGKVRFFDGVKEFISLLNKKNIPIAIVTAGHLDQLKKTVPGSFLNRFNAIVTGDQVSRNKPFPDPYLKGAELLGFNGGDCIAVENAPLGIKSARTAGCYCVGISSTVSAEELNDADEIYKTMNDMMVATLAS